jgi:hypothetical protein
MIPSSPHGSHRTRPPQNAARPFFPQPSRSSPLENVHVVQRYVTTDPIVAPSSGSALNAERRATS